MRLGVNIDHVATLRQARRGHAPDPIDAALACERAGADRIVCHLREDRRHIQDADVRRLIKVLRRGLNLEMSMAGEIVTVALALRPAQVTLVPEHRQELTTEGGLDAARHGAKLRRVIRRFEKQGIAVSLFIDATARQVRAAQAAGAGIIELHTGRYAQAHRVSSRARELQALRTAAALGRSLGLQVAAGHGLEYENVRPVLEIREIEELNIGFSIIARAMVIGLEGAVSEMAGLVSGGAHAG